MREIEFKKDGAELRVLPHFAPRLQQMNFTKAKLIEAAKRSAKDESLSSSLRGNLSRGTHFILGEKESIFLLKKYSKERAAQEHELLKQLRKAGVSALEPVGTAEIDGMHFVITPLVKDAQTAWNYTYGITNNKQKLLALARVMGTTIGAAHRFGLQHKDLRPDNILIKTDANGIATEAILTDFESSNAPQLDRRKKQVDLAPLLYGISLGVHRKVTHEEKSVFLHAYDPKLGVTFDRLQRINELKAKKGGK